MKLFTFLLILLCLFSCENETRNFKYLDAYIFNHWLGANKVESLYPEAFFPDKSLTEPQMTWKSLLRVEANNHIYCLNYRIPHRRQSMGKGSLHITTILKGQKCSDFLAKKPEIRVEGISHFKIYFTPKFEKNLRSKSTKKAFHLYLSGSRIEEDNWKMMLPLYNINSANLINPNKLTKKKKTFERYDEPWKDSLRPGMNIYLGDFLAKEKVGQNRSNQVSNENLNFCHKLDRNCKTVQEFKCNECTNGWYSVVDYKCDEGGSKVCGPSLCGRLNQPACPRGESFEGVVDNNLCFRGSKAGICEKGLDTYCNEDNVLICK